MDNLSVSDEYYDKKYEDMQVRLDKLYDEIEEIEISIEAVETRLYNIKQEKISGDNVYQFLLFFYQSVRQIYRYGEEDIYEEIPPPYETGKAVIEQS